MIFTDLHLYDNLHTAIKRVVSLHEQLVWLPTAREYLSSSTGQRCEGSKENNYTEQMFFTSTWSKAHKDTEIRRNIGIMKTAHHATGSGRGMSLQQWGRVEMRGGTTLLLLGMSLRAWALSGNDPHWIYVLLFLIYLLLACNVIMWLYLCIFSIDLTPQSRDLLEKLTVTELVKKFPAFYGTRWSTDVFTRPRHWTLSWARWIQSTSNHPISLKPIQTLYFQLSLGLPSGLSLQVFRPKIRMHFSSLPLVLHVLPISSS